MAVAKRMRFVQISDFGISKFLTPEEQTSMTSGLGTHKYMAPEVIDEDNNYDEKVDVYSFGVMTFFILTGGELPAIKMSDKMKGKKAPIPSNFTDFSREIINKCWNFDSKDRPSFKEIVELMERNDFKLIELTETETFEVKDKINQHKTKIPQY